MDKNSLSHTTWECKYHIVFEAAELFGGSMFRTRPKASVQKKVLH